MAMTIADYEQNGSDAEKALIKACREGEACILGDLPPETGEAPTVRAELIRCLALEATSLHEVGVILMGARIVGILDLRFATCKGRLALDKCRFIERPQMEHAELAQLSMQCSHLPGLSAQGVKVDGSVFFRRMMTTGTLNINSARIGGQLACEGAVLNGMAKKALNAQGARVTNSVCLCDLKATGTVTVAGAQIGGQLDCSHAKFNGNGSVALNAQGAKIKADLFLRIVTATGTLNMSGAEIGGQLTCNGAILKGHSGTALDGQSLLVEQGLYFREVKLIMGQVMLNAASVDQIFDDAASWAKCTDLILDGLIYDRISGNTSPKTFDHRKEWLEKGSRFKGQFFPQPYTQFAKVMRASGHLGEARKALMARDTILFREAEKADREALRAAWGGTDAKRGDCGWIWLRLQGRRFWAGLSRRVIGHGHKPERALFWAFGAWGLGTLVYFIAYRVGLMVPNSDVIMVSSEWLAAVRASPDAPTMAWMQDGVLASKHYETFFAGIYALDLFLPIVDLGQESTWAVTTTTACGWVLRVGTLLYQVAGWVIVSLGIAAVTGFVQRNDPE